MPIPMADRTHQAEIICPHCGAAVQLQYEFPRYSHEEVTCTRCGEEFVALTRVTITTLTTEEEAAHAD